MEKRKQYDGWESVKTDTVAKAYTDVRAQLWKPLANQVGAQWEDVEAKVCILSVLSSMFEMGLMIRLVHGGGSQIT